MNVLLVDDNPADVEQIKTLLGQAAGAEFRIHWMSRLSAATERLRARGLDLVLLNLDLPDMRGLAGLDAVHEAYPHVPIVALLERNDPVQGVAAVQRGAQDVLAKDGLSGPLLAQTLRYAYERYFHMAASQAEDRRRQWQRQLDLPEERTAPEADAASGEPAGGVPDETETALEELYATMLRAYVGALRARATPPRELIEDLTQALCARRVRARDIARLHSRTLHRVARRALPDTERRFAADARLALIEIFGRVLDHYRPPAAGEDAGPSSPASAADIDRRSG